MAERAADDMAWDHQPRGQTMISALIISTVLSLAIAIWVGRAPEPAIGKPAIDPYYCGKSRHDSPGE